MSYNLNDEQKRTRDTADLFMLAAAWFAVGFALASLLAAIYMR